MFENFIMIIILRDSNKIKLENLNKYEKRILVFFNSSSDSAASSSGRFGETFLSLAFVSLLLDIALQSRDPKILLEGLKIVSKLNSSSTADQVSNWI